MADAARLDLLGISPAPRGYAGVVRRPRRRLNGSGVRNVRFAEAQRRMTTSFVFMGA